MVKGLSGRKAFVLLNYDRNILSDLAQTRATLLLPATCRMDLLKTKGGFTGTLRPV